MEIQRIKCKQQLWARVRIHDCVPAATEQFFSPSLSLLIDEMNSHMMHIVYCVHVYVTLCTMRCLCNDSMTE